MGIFNFFQDRIDGTARRAASRAVQNAFNSGLAGFRNMAQITLDPSQVKDFGRYYRQTGAVYECVDLILKKLVAAPVLTFRVKDPEQYKTYKSLCRSPHIEHRVKALKLRASVIEEVNVPEIQALLKKPNARQTGRKFIEALGGNFLLRGNSFVYGNAGLGLKDGKWNEMFAMPPLQIIASGTGWNRKIEGYALEGSAASVEFPARQIQHIRTFNPFYDSSGSHLYGLSPLAAYVYPLDKIDNAHKQSDSQIKNGGKMGLLSPKNPEDLLEGEQKQELRAELKRSYGSSDAMDRLIPSAIGLDWTEIGMSSQDMQLIEVYGLSNDDIYLCYHVPLQFRRNDASSYNNLTTAKKAFIYDAVAPIADEISDALTDFICPAYADQGEYVIRIDYTVLPELAADMKELSDWLLKSYEITMNERRELKGFGRLEAPGMDEVFLPRNYVRLQDIMDGKIQQGSATSDSAGRENDGNDPEGDS